jgi:hypothetical protein
MIKVNGDSMNWFAPDTVSGDTLTAKGRTQNSPKIATSQGLRKRLPVISRYLITNAPTMVAVTRRKELNPTGGCRSSTPKQNKLSVESAFSVRGLNMINPIGIHMEHCL